MQVSYVEIVFIAVIATVFVWDGVLFARRGEPGTVSYRIAMWSLKYPIIAVLFGALIGHLFWPNRGYCQ